MLEPRHILIKNVYLLELKLSRTYVNKHKVEEELQVLEHKIRMSESTTTTSSIRVKNIRQLT